MNKEKFSEELSRISYPYGRDRKGNPIIYTNYAAMAKANLLSDVDKFVRWRVSVLEKALASADFTTDGEKITNIADWYGCGLFLDGKVNESQSKLNAIMRVSISTLLSVNTTGLLSRMLRISRCPQCDSPQGTPQRCLFILVSPL